MEEQVRNYFEVLNSINVQDKVEKKNGLSYLSWAFAWGEIKKIHPTANYVIYERETEYGPVNYFTDGRTAWVKTGVIIDDIEHIEELPVMDYKNKSILLENITSFDVNKTIQRSLTKAVARHGLGLYIYAGEDMPEGEEETKVNMITPAQLNVLNKLSDTDKEKVYKKYEVNSLEEMTMVQASELISKLKGNK